jgi:hypothetical protein
MIDRARNSPLALKTGTNFASTSISSPAHGLRQSVPRQASQFTSAGRMWG